MKAVLSSALALVAAGVACGDSKHSNSGNDAGGDTQPPTTTPSPNGGVTRGRVVLTADEPATVYYTNDGSTPTTSSPNGPSPVAVDLTASATLSFFAVDAAGNTEQVKSLAFDVRKFGTLPLEYINARAAASDIAVKWIKPQDANQVVIVRSIDAVYKVPEDGKAFAVGDSYEGGKVAYVGAADNFVDTAPGNGGHLYTGFVRAGNGTYSEARSAGAAIRPVQEGVLRFDTVGQTATVMTQPADATIAVANVAVQGGGDTSVDITITSTLPSPIFGMKLVFKDLAVANTVVGVSGAVASRLTPSQLKYPDAAVVHWGPTAMTNGVAVTKRVTIRGLGTPPGTVDVNIALQSDAVIYGAIWGSDAKNGLVATDNAALNSVEGFALAKPFTPPNTIKQYAYRPGGVSPDGRFLYLGHRNQPRLVKLDATTGNEVAGVDLAITSVDGAAGDLELDPSGTRLWVVLNEGMHAAGSKTTVAGYGARGRQPVNNTVYLVEVDPATMAEIARIKLGNGDATFRGHRLTVSRDGRHIAVPLGRTYDEALAVSTGKVAYVNAETMTLIDADPTTPNVDLIDMPDEIRSSQCAFSWTAAKLVCNTSFSTNNAASDTDAVGVVDLTQPTLQMTALDSIPTATGNHKVVHMIANSDGSFWLLGYFPALIKLNADNTFATIGTTSTRVESYGYVDPNTDGRLIISDYGQTSAIDTATGMLTRLTTTSTSGFGHHPMLSPY